MLRRFSETPSALRLFSSRDGDAFAMKAPVVTVGIEQENLEFESVTEVSEQSAKFMIERLILVTLEIKSTSEYTPLGWEDSLD